MGKTINYLDSFTYNICYAALITMNINDTAQLTLIIFTHVYTTNIKLRLINVCLLFIRKMFTFQTSFELYSRSIICTSSHRFIEDQLTFYEGEGEGTTT